jgi:hypothetical protein
MKNFNETFKKKNFFVKYKKKKKIFFFLLLQCDRKKIVGTSGTQNIKTKEKNKNI